MNDFRNQSPWGSPPPGGGGNGDGGFRRGPTPPNLDEILKKLQDTINRFLPGKSGGAKPIVVGLIILALLWIGSGLYRVLPDEQGVVLTNLPNLKTTPCSSGNTLYKPLPTQSSAKITKPTIKGFDPPELPGRSLFIVFCSFFKISSKFGGVGPLLKPPSPFPPPPGGGDPHGL